MIKFIVQYHQINHDEHYFPDVTEEVPGATIEEYESIQVEQIRSSFRQKQEARLDETGKPYIYAWNEWYPSVSFEDWQKVGFEHTQIKEESFNIPRWIYTRKITKTIWTITVETLEQIEEFLDRNYDIGLLDEPINGIRYYLTITRYD